MLSQYIFTAQPKPLCRDEIRGSSLKNSLSYHEPLSHRIIFLDDYEPSDNSSLSNKQECLNNTSTQKDLNLDVDVNRRRNHVLFVDELPKCDFCPQLRTKCNGEAPCSHCIGMSFKIFSNFQSLFILSSM